MRIPKNTRKAILKSIAIAFTSISIVLAVFLCCKIYDRKAPNFKTRCELYVYPGATADSVFSVIAGKAGVKWMGSLRRVFNEQSRYGSVKPGHYTVDTTSTSSYVARMLFNGWQTPVRLVLSGTMRRNDGIARKISSQMLLDSAEVASALEDSTLLAGLGFTPSNVFALFLPDSYEVYWTDSMEKILERQKAAYDAFWTPERKELAKKRGLTPMQVSVVASIVKGETNYEPEMPAIAGVYLNRLKNGMKLQADPTIAYIYNYELNRILKKHLDAESPYNTYKYAGLPPGPIAVPTKACLEAVLNPDPHGYLYFCASPDLNGTHLFASTYAEHRRNAKAFHKAISARMKAQKQ